MYRVKGLAVIGAIIMAAVLSALWLANAWIVGRTLDSYRGVQVFDNGLVYFRAHGRNYARDGYYLGQKWQCVEFIKRFYFDAFGHRMPEVMGHAKDYFDPAVSHGRVNPRRGMVQYVNGGDEPPAPDDLLVFRDTAYGHVAIVTSVTPGSIEVIQQNIIGHPRQKFGLEHKGTSFRITSPRSPAGWLRLPAGAKTNALPAELQKTTR